MNINIDIQELKELTQAAIEDAEERRKEREAQATLHKAEGIINQIPSRCAKEAEQGRSHAIVMGLTYSEFNKIHEPIQDSFEEAGVHVWNACQEAQMKPTLEHWHDGGGMRGGYNIVVHWEKDEES